jgi:hypothetical protein
MDMPLLEAKHAANDAAVVRITNHIICAYQYQYWCVSHVMCTIDYGIVQVLVDVPENETLARPLLRMPDCSMLRLRAFASMHGLSSSTSNCRLWVGPPRRPHSSGSTPDNKFDARSTVRSCVSPTHMSGRVPSSRAKQVAGFDVSA